MSGSDLLPRLAAAFLLILSLSGCALLRRPEPRPPLPAGFPDHSAKEIASFVAQAGASIHSLRARASFSVESPEQSGTFSSEVRARRNDSLPITISPGLGIEAARVLVTPDSVFIYDRINNELRYGAAGDASAAMGIPLGEADLFGNLIGSFVPPDAAAWRVEATREEYILTDPEGRRVLVVDPRVWRISRYEERNSSGGLVEERAFSEFHRFGSHFLPRRVQFRRPEDGSGAAVYYRDIEAEVTGLSFSLRLSRSAERIPL